MSAPAEQTGGSSLTQHEEPRENDAWSSSHSAGLHEHSSRSERNRDKEGANVEDDHEQIASYNTRHKNQNVLAFHSDCDRSIVSTSKNLPGEVLSMFKAYRKTRMCLSDHWFSFQEQYDNYRRDQNHMANMVAILVQELEIHGHQDIAAKIEQVHASLAVAEAELEVCFQQVREGERQLRSAERSFLSDLSGMSSACS